MEILLSDLVFPAIYTTIGAVIGGWCAYLIAKRNFMLDRLHQGDECVELLKFSTDNLNTQCDALHNHIRTYTDCQEEDECIAFLRNLTDKGVQVKTAISSFSSCWARNSDTISLCTTKSVCSNREKREKYKTFYNAITKAVDETTRFDRIIEKYTKLYNKARNPDSFKARAFLNHPEMKELLRAANDTLNELLKMCTEINNAYTVLNS